MKDTPSDSDLAHITAWPVDDTGYGPLFAFVYDRWDHAMGGWERKGSLYRLTTGGWSGNEALIDALRGNAVFWGLTFVAHITGGLYFFDDAQDAEWTPRVRADLLTELRRAGLATFRSTTS